MKHLEESRVVCRYGKEISVFEDGSIWMHGKGTKRKFGHTTYKGYKATIIRDQHGRNHTVFIHRLVAMAFIPNPDNKPTVNHINEIKDDNRVENLEWATTAEQNTHGTRIARAMAHTDWNKRNEKTDYAAVAEKHDYSKQSMCNRKLTRVLKDGVVVGEFRSQREASVFSGVSRSKVSQCVSGIRQTCKGYSFEQI